MCMHRMESIYSKRYQLNQKIQRCAAIFVCNHYSWITDVTGLISRVSNQEDPIIKSPPFFSFPISYQILDCKCVIKFHYSSLRAGNLRIMYCSFLAEYPALLWLPPHTTTFICTNPHFNTITHSVCTTTAGWLLLCDNLQLRITTTYTSYTYMH